jgi:steroid delta-isomerase-like uncharacterized protein
MRCTQMLGDLSRDRREVRIQKRRLVPQQEGTFMTAEENVAIVRGWAHAAFNQHDLDAAAQFLAPDWVGHWAGLGEEHGVEGFKRLAGAYVRGFPDMQIAVEDALADGDRVVRRVSWTGTHQGQFLGIAPTSRHVRGEQIVIMRIADGKIAEEWEMSNLLGLLQQLGAVPTFSLEAAPT